MTEEKYQKYMEEKIDFITKEEFSKLTKNKNIEIKYINESYGKGVFSTKEFKYGEIIFYEEPLSSQINVNNDESIKTCTFCMRSFNKPNNIKFKLKECEKYYPKEIFYCNDCTFELYCSIDCNFIYQIKKKKKKLIN
jgi:hypothetical protein